MSHHSTTNKNHLRRVVITGVGAYTPLARTAPETWQRLLAGESAIHPIERFDMGDLPVQIAGEITDTPELPFLDHKTSRNLARYASFGMAAAHEAIEDAGLCIDDYNPHRSGVVTGTGGGGFWDIIQANDAFVTRGYRRISPRFMTTWPFNMCSYHIAEAFRMLGPSTAISTACATGSQAVADAAGFIRLGKADVMVAGGAEHSVFPMFIASFAIQKAASTRNEEPQLASRPFDADRTGFVISEGAGMLVLEDLEHALRRGARIYAELLGSGASNDGYHPIAPEPDGVGASQAIVMAMEEAGVEPADIDFVNAHAASTPLGDAAETRAIKLALGEERAYEIPVNSTKSMMGHAMGAAGAIECVATVLSIRDGIIHPTINYETVDPECDLDYVPEGAREVEIRTAIKNSFGLGGMNASLVFGRWNGS